MSLILSLRLACLFRISLCILVSGLELVCLVVFLSLVTFSGGVFSPTSCGGCTVSAPVGWITEPVLGTCVLGFLLFSSSSCDLSAVAVGTLAGSLSVLLTCLLLADLDLVTAASRLMAFK